MSLKSTISNAVNAAMNALGDIPVTATFTDVAPGTFDPESGAYSGGSETNHSVSAIFSQYKIERIDGTVIQQGDAKLTLRQADLAITPALGDKVSINGVSYSILNISSDPANATWTLQLRR